MPPSSPGAPPPSRARSKLDCSSEGLPLELAASVDFDDRFNGGGGATEVRRLGGGGGGRRRLLSRGGFEGSAAAEPFEADSFLFGFGGGGPLGSGREVLFFGGLAVLLVEVVASVWAVR